MILYFTGTGNSEYAAKRIGKETGDEVLNLFERIRGKDFSEIHSDRPFVIVAPTYAWRMPHIVEDWLRKTNLNGNKNIYFVTTCGGGAGNIGKYLKKIAEEKQMNYMGCMELIMPDNYIALYNPSTQEEAVERIKRINPIIDETARLIKNGEAFPPKTDVSIVGKMGSSLINTGFYAFYIGARKFYATDACTSCGKCCKVCPLDNIQLKDGKPIWGKDCTHCMACICGCPAEAIEYGKLTKNRVRYTFPKDI